MKKNIIYLLFICLAVSKAVYAQLPAIDPLSGAGSSALLVEYRVLENAERNLTRASRDFAQNYNKRIAHKFDIRDYTPADSFKEKIVDRLSDAFLRLESLTISNNQLTGFSQYRKNKNQGKLSVVRANLINTREKFKRKLRSFGIYGEKMNLYQNFMMSMDDINRMMDDVEDNIETGSKLGTILKN